MMEDFDGDGLPGFYELANGTNPYLPERHQHSLDMELPDEVCVVKLLPPSAASTINSGKHLPIITVNQDKLALVHDVVGIPFSRAMGTVTTYECPKSETRKVYSQPIRSNDSGSPTFLVCGDHLVLVGVHSAVGKDSSVALVIDAIQAAMNVLRSGYELQLEDGFDNTMNWQ